MYEVNVVLAVRLLRDYYCELNDIVGLLMQDKITVEEWEDLMADTDEKYAELIVKETA